MIRVTEAQFPGFLWTPNPGLPNRSKHITRIRRTMAARGFLCRCSACFLAFPLLVNAWGKIGHEIVGNLAWSLLSPSTRGQAADILGINGTTTSNCDEYCSPLALVSDWADIVRYTSYYHWTAPLHFIDIHDQQIPGHCRVNNSSRCHFVYDRDCPQDVCVAGAVVNYTHRVVTQPEVAAKRESLKFLVHFVGDIHQPLHCSRTSDLGGNSIHVTYLNKTVSSTSTSAVERRRTLRTRKHHSLNLHSVWDSSMIETALKLRHHGSRNAMEDSLLDLIEQAQHSADWDTVWTLCANGASLDCVSGWAEESIASALQYAYANVDGTDIQSGDHLSYDYYLSREPVIREQLARAGVRLAATLETALSGTEWSSVLHQQQ